MLGADGVRTFFSVIENNFRYVKIILYGNDFGVDIDFSWEIRYS